MDHMRPQLFCNDNCPIGAPIIYDQAPPACVMPSRAFSMQAISISASFRQGIAVVNSTRPAVSAPVGALAP